MSEAQRGDAAFERWRRVIFTGERLFGVTELHDAWNAGCLHERARVYGLLDEMTDVEVADAIKTLLVRHEDG